MKAKPTSKQPNATPCPCGSGLTYAQCCAPLHEGTATSAATPEPLMRSRYSAFALGLKDYLLASWAPETRPAAPLQLDTDVKWLGLKIIEVSVAADGEQGIVEFVARSRQRGKGQRLHERSRFRRTEGGWLYIDGNIDPGASD